MEIVYPKEEGEEAVSPMGQYFNSSILRIYIIGVLEFQVPFDNSRASPLVRDVFLPINSRFSSIMVQDRKGEKRWKRIEVNLKDHIKIPVFPPETSPESNQKYFGDYLSRIATEPLSQNMPLWEIHIINYKTKNAASTVVFKLHHALGDGYSLMGALLSCLQRADDPSLPLAFPSLKPSKTESAGKFQRVFRMFSGIASATVNTVADFGWSMLKSSVMEDDKSPIRSGDEGAQFRPIVISTMVFSINQIKEIKSRLGVTLNDVMTGIIFCGTRLYMQDIDEKSRSADSTALVLHNTRNIEGYKSIDEMLNTKSKGPWGNRIAFLHVPIPKLNDSRISDPLQFVWEAHHTIKRKRQSLAVPLTAALLEMERRFRGHEAVAKHIYSTSAKSSTVITNMVGPLQQMSLANHLVKGFYFTLAGGPQSLVISIMSYVGELRVTFKTEKDFIDEQKLKSGFKTAFEMILGAATQIHPTKANES